MSEKEDYITLINNNIKHILTDITLQLSCQNPKKQSITQALAFLADIVKVYGTSSEHLINETFNRLGQIKHLYQFEVDDLVKQLYSKFFSQIHVFRQAYQISVLKLDLPKYRHLKVEQPLITITIPKPYISPTLNDAKYLGEGNILTLDEDEQPLA